MDGNGHVGEAFDMEMGLVLRNLQATGFNSDFLEGLQEMVSTVSLTLQRFHHDRRQAGDSGRFTRQGLEEHAGAWPPKPRGTFTACWISR
jgi:hypothetical protein